jgi:hypothetical protein
MLVDLSIQSTLEFHNLGHIQVDALFSGPRKLPRLTKMDIGTLDVRPKHPWILSCWP